MLCMRRGREGRGGGASGKHMLYYNAKKANLMMALAFFFTHTGQPRSFFVRNFQVLAFVRQGNIIALFYFRPVPFQVVPISRVFPFPPIPQQEV